MMVIDWTEVKALEALEAGEEWRLVDGTDQEFYHSPWNEADEGDVFGFFHEKPGDYHMEGMAGVTLGRRGDDHVRFWRPTDQDAAKEHLFQARIAMLRERRLRDLKELEELVID